ncbi:AmmeMemoRadiSam system radical SAM enzyme [Pseudomaricurvus alkylphenolicus]|uniref:AmmeMemoRadiSam system radical SAM enzyme n=1 Tax=Pseudomaricurvus alkylphenolicus TaxID=1306991 RepID=UPI00141DF419|nr:AmmeMemoRadiSam system radical SAM enzyme [Pseudomaricurvus alkylphenolicus]NIB43746.1 AmmeMemoRadiSam system radical SAM enzyme [Pseudomaricurvus alkylphenolicus]
MPSSHLLFQAPGSFPTEYWHTLDNGKTQCDLCPRYCKLKDGQRGLCFVRGCENGEIRLFSYGRSSGFCIDPIEKKPLNHFLPGTSVLSFGTAGCNLACKFCQNWDMSKSRQMDALADQASPTALADAASSHDCRSIAFTYNDPVTFYEYAIDTAQACRERGINSVAVTAGYICEAPRERFFAHMDAVNVDLKSFNDAFYYKLCGGHLEPVLETLQYIHHKSSAWLEITTLLIPGENDSDQELHRLSEWIAEHLGANVPLHFTAFHPDWKMRDIPPTPPETLSRARAIALEKGLHYVYTGNVHDREGGSTYCPVCEELLIERDWYQLREWHLDNGHCSFCGARISGHFESRPGHWGAQRQRVRIV